MSRPLSWEPVSVLRSIAKELCRCDWGSELYNGKIILDCSSGSNLATWALKRGRQVMGLKNGSITRICWPVACSKMWETLCKDQKEDYRKWGSFPGGGQQGYRDFSPKIAWTAFCQHLNEQGNGWSRTQRKKHSPAHTLVLVQWEM